MRVIAIQAEDTVKEKLDAYLKVTKQKLKKYLADLIVADIEQNMPEAQARTEITELLEKEKAENEPERCEVCETILEEGEHDLCEICAEQDEISRAEEKEDDVAVIKVNDVKIAEVRKTDISKKTKAKNKKNNKNSKKSPKSH